jgi:hypothetical protein
MLNIVDPYIDHHLVDAALITYHINIVYYMELINIHATRLAA